ncbi:MAG TPA: hypothetical protein HA263_08155 [Methanoregulaceae archaeon]|nr:hypothetical protein [Methanoregulaceae archaeon]
MTFRPADKDQMLAELKRDDTIVDLDPSAPWSFGSGINTIGESTLLDGHGAVLNWPTNMGRLRIDHAPGVTIRNINLVGWVNIHNVVSPRFTCEDVSIVNSVPGAPYLDIGKAGGATGAFNIQGDAGVTLEDLAFRRCVSENPYHHSFNLNLQDHAEGGGYKNVLFEDCVSKGAGAIVPGRDPKTIWSCALDVDAGDIDGLTVRRFRADGPIQDGVHLDGSWEGHRQYQRNVLVEDCIITNAGRRCPAESVEKFRSGIYMQNGTIRNVHTEGCAGAGFALKNQESTMLKVVGCSDTGSQYGMICEYGAPNAAIEFTSTSATRRAFLGQVGGSGTLDLTIFDPPAVAVTLGRTIRSDYIDCPNHAHDRDVGKYAVLGYAVNGANITIRSPQKPVVEVWRDNSGSPSRLNGSITYIVAGTEPETKPPVDDPTIPPVVPPAVPIPREYLLREDLALNLYDCNGVRRWTMFPPDNVRALLPPGTKYVPEGV